MANYMPEGYPETPETDKQIRLVAERHTQDVGAFMEWLEEQGWQLGRWDEDGTPILGLAPSINDLLAQWVGIDLAKVERERRALLVYLSRNANKEG